MTVRLPSRGARKVVNVLQSIEDICGKNDYALNPNRAVWQALKCLFPAGFDLDARNLCKDEEAVSKREEALYKLCDAILLQRGAAGTIEEREICTYREGFYRGTSIALILLAFSLFVPLVTHAKVCVVPSLPSIHPPFLLFVMVSTVGSCMFFLRYRRFRQRRIAYGFSGLLAVLTTHRADQNSEGGTQSKSSN